MEDKMLYFMNKLIDEDVNGFDDWKFELERKYAAMFGHGVPREMFLNTTLQLLIVDSTHYGETRRICNEK